MLKIKFILLLSFMPLYSLFSHDLDTPNGSDVTHGHPTDGSWYGCPPGYPCGTYSASWWTSWSDAYYVNFYEERLARANKAYNCHSYAWAGARQSDSNTWCWIGWYSGDEEDIYWEDGSYAGSEVECGTFVNYREEDHSLELTGNMIESQYEVRSKWGKLPLYRHKLWSDPYGESESNTKYYHLSITSGNLSCDETWWGSHLLDGNITVPSGTILTINSAASVDLDNFYIKSTGGTITRQSGVTFNPKDIAVKSGSALKGQYPSFASALSNVVTNQTIEVVSGISSISGTIPSGVTLKVYTNLTVPSGTLTFSSSSAVYLYNSYIKSTGGTITDNGATVSPDIAVKSGSTLLGQYSTIGSAITNAISGQDVHLAAGSYYCLPYGLDMKTGVGVIGENKNSTTVEGQVEFDNVRNATLSNVTVEYGIVMNSGWGNTLSNIIVDNTSESIELNYGYTQYLSGVEVDIYTNPDVDIYHGEAEVDGFKSTRSKDYGIYLNGYQLDIYDSEYPQGIIGKDKAIYLTGYSDTNVDYVYFCYNDYDIYAEYGCRGAAGNGTIFSGDPASTIYGDVQYPYDWDACGLKKSIVSDEGTSIGELNLSTTSGQSDDPGLIDYQKALEVYRAIKQLLRTDFKAGKKPDPLQYASDYAIAIDLFEQVVDKYPGTLSSIKALGKVASCYWALNQPQSLSDYLNKIVDNPQYAVLKPHAYNLLIPYHLHVKDYQQALQLSDEIFADSPDENMSCDVLYGKGIIYLYYVEDTTRAAEAFQQVLARYPDSPTAFLAQAKLEKMGESVPIPGEPATAPETIETLALEGYPNPFNPTATIRFGLPEAGRVTLVVYDLMGREVVRLVEGYRDAGWQAIVWDGRNARGREVPTGIYIARLVTPQGAKAMKLVMMK